jgi:glycosyltransferase involved in cell wall biosynthesis
MDLFSGDASLPLAQRPGLSASLIVPTYNEARRLGKTIPLLRAEFRGQPGVEVIFVDDGSQDGTPDVISAHIRDWPAARLIRIPWNQGKGAAIKAGVGQARNERLVFMDADLSSDLADLPALVGALDDADVVLGSRSIAGAKVSYTRDRSLRKVQSKFFNGFACALAGIVASDTQCGFKAFRADSAKLLFHLVEGKGFAFDVEVLALAQLLDFRIVEVPIRWVEAEGTTVRPVRDPLIMIRDLLRTRRRCRHLERVSGRFVWETSEAPLDADRMTDNEETITALLDMTAQESTREVVIDVRATSDDNEHVAVTSGLPDAATQTG